MPGAGVFGPYRRGRRWIVHVRTVAGDPGTSYSFASEGDAKAFVKSEKPSVEIIRQTATRTLGDAVEAYDKHLTDAGHKQRVETLRRIRAFFDGEMELGLRLLTPARCRRLYERATKRKATRWVGSGEARKLVELDKTVAPDTHRGMLTHSKTFLAWCVSKRWIKASPLADVKPVGKLKHGKPQLRIDEARRWYDTALALGEKEPGALAALCALLLGLRATEITTRVVRDLDDGGRLLWIPTSKTEAGRRVLEVPAPLRPRLAALAHGRAGDALLFGGRVDDKGQPAPHHRGWILFWTKKIAAASGVPKVSAHSMRGLHATLAMQAGATSHLVAGALGHADAAVTVTSYAQPGAGADARSKAALGVLTGGKAKPTR